MTDVLDVIVSSKDMWTLYVTAPGVREGNIESDCRYVALVAVHCQGLVQ